MSQVLKKGTRTLARLFGGSYKIIDLHLHKKSKSDVIAAEDSDQEMNGGDEDQGAGKGDVLGAVQGQCTLV
jgi:hypothetical protein